MYIYIHTYLAAQVCPEGLAEADGGGRLALAQGRRVDARDHHVVAQLGVR